MIWFLHCVPNWHISRPFDLILLFHTKLTPSKTIWPDFCIVNPIDSFWNHMTWFLYCVSNWLLLKPFDLIQDHFTWLLYCVPNWLLSRPFDLILSYDLERSQMVHNTKIRSYDLERSQLGTQCKNQVIWSWKESTGYRMIKSCQMVLD